MITEEMREVAWRAFKLSQNAGPAEYIPLVKALEAVEPMVRNATLEEAAKVAESEIQNAAWLKGIGAVHDGACIAIARAIRALRTPSVAE